MLFDQQIYLEYRSALELQWKVYFKLGHGRNQHLSHATVRQRTDCHGHPHRATLIQREQSLSAEIREPVLVHHPQFPCTSKWDFCRIISTGGLITSRDASPEGEYPRTCTSWSRPTWSCRLWALGIVLKRRTTKTCSVWFIRSHPSTSVYSPP